MSHIFRMLRIVLTLAVFGTAAAMMMPAGAEPARRPAVAEIGYRGQVNVNTAGIKMLMRLPGVGETKARRIVKARPFAGPADLLKVKGIGRGTLKKLLPLIKFDGKSDLVKVRKKAAR